MRAAVLAAALPLASAFISPALPSASLNKRAGPVMAITAGEDLQFGSTAPLGYFDPLGFSSRPDADIRKWREAELKHGRVAMLATVGYLVQEKWHPLFGLKNVDVGPSLTHFQQVVKVTGPWFVVGLLWVIALSESQALIRGWGRLDDAPQGGITPLREDYITGDLGLDPFAIRFEDERFADLRTKELNNGRLAMISILGMWAQEFQTGQPIIQ